MLKADLHLHAGEDKHHKIKYSSKELIAHAVKQGFEVLALTFHGDVYYNNDLKKYAEKKGVLLIPGVEKLVEGKEVLLYNVSQSESKEIKTFEDIRALKKRKKDILVIAPHPYFVVGPCLGKTLIENIDVFDGVEYSHFYLLFFNLNKKANRVAKKYNKTLIGTSDAHNLKQIGMTYGLVDSEKNIKSFFEAVRKGKVKLETKPVSLWYFIWRTFRMVLDIE
ncbi:MAG: PHP domain-containing protein [archaeon]